MWTFLIVVGLLDQSQAAPLPEKYGSPQPYLQQQVQSAQSTPSPDPPQQKTSSSSSSSSSLSSSSSSDSSESSQSGKAFQLLKERQNLENTAVEQVDVSQESSDFVLPSSSSSLQLNELVLLGQRALQRDAGDVEDHNKTVQPTFHLLLSPSRETPQTPKVGGEFHEGGVSVNDMGGARDDHKADEENINGFPHLQDDSVEGAEELAFHRPGYHGDEAGLELAL